MKSLHLITGGILVMIAVILLAPQKTTIIAEEKATIPLGGHRRLHSGIGETIG